MSQFGGKDANEWIEQNPPENGLFRAYWTADIVHDPKCESFVTHEDHNCQGTKCGIGATIQNNGGNIRWEWEYVDDKKHGESKGYFSNGILKHTRWYKHGVPHGSLKEYHEPSRGAPLLWHYQNYEDGNIEGEEYWLYTDGTQKARSRNWVNGYLQGKSVSWYKNGNVREETNFVDGFEHGTRTTFKIDGSKIRESNHVMGKIVSVLNYD